MGDAKGLPVIKSGEIQDAVYFNYFNFLWQDGCSSLFKIGDKAFTAYGDRV